MARLGPGPVFAYEWKVMTRRWQPYATRAAFVAAVLAALTVAWWSRVAGRPMVTAEQRGQVGLAFFGGIVTATLALVLAVAPAVTCGAICRDRARGHLTLLLVSDLSDAEIVLGKLLAWLAPAVGLVIGVMPVAAIASVIGGIDPAAMAGLMLVASGLAVLGATLALTLSVWGTRPTEVLLAVYAVWVLWLLSGPTWNLLSWLWGIPGPSVWYVKTNPFDLCGMPYWRPNDDRWYDGPVFLAVCLLISALLAALATRRVRSVSVRQMGGEGGASAGRRRGRRRGWGGGPALDRDPIAWRERRQSTLSPWGRALIGLYAAIASAFSLLAVFDSLRPYNPNFGHLPSFVNAFQVVFGLPMLGLWASSSLAEERDTGAIAVLLTTPRSTREIVRAKWWAYARRIPWLLLLPAAVLGPIAWITGAWAWAGIVLLLFASQAAALVSLGLALATWIRRPSITLGLYVAIVVFVSLGLGFGSYMIVPWDWTIEVTTVSPFYAAFYGTDRLVFVGPPTIRLMLAQAAWTLVYLALAAGLLLATRCSFERCLGRIPERAGRPEVGRRRFRRQTATASPAGSASGSASMYS